MKVFLDTSSLLKLYHQESGTEDIENLFSSVNVTSVFLAEITKLEIISAIWKKVRTKEVTETDAFKIIALFEMDLKKYIFITTDNFILENARILLNKYHVEGLRTLDSIQLSTCISLSQQADLFLTSDNLLKELLQKEHLPVEITN